jgi:hypothetical protein
VDDDGMDDDYAVCAGIIAGMSCGRGADVLRNEDA